jgi:hypothetical protein
VWSDNDKAACDKLVDLWRTLDWIKKIKEKKTQKNKGDGEENGLLAT